MWLMWYWDFPKERMERPQGGDFYQQTPHRHQQSTHWILMLKKTITWHIWIRLCSVSVSICWCWTDYINEHSTCFFKSVSCVCSWSVWFNSVFTCIIQLHPPQWEWLYQPALRFSQISHFTITDHLSQVQRSTPVGMIWNWETYK